MNGTCTTCGFTEPYADEPQHLQENDKPIAKQYTKEVKKRGDALRLLMQRKWLHRFIVLAVFGSLAYVVTVHFWLTFLYLAPLNPLKVDHWQAVYQHTQDLFAQNWSLFAPEPLHNNTVLLTQCRLDNGEETTWYNISSGLVEGLHQNPLGPFVRLARMHLAAIRFYQGHSDPSSELVAQKVCEADATNPVCSKQDQQSVAIKDLGRKAFTRMGSAVCSQIVGYGRTVAAVRLRVIAASVRPISERQNLAWKPELMGVVSEWFPFESVAAIPVKRIEVGES